MKIKKNAYQISDAVNISALDPKNLNVFKIFSLPFWLIVISIGFSCASQSVRAGIEDVDLYYRYVPYQGPSSTTGTGNQPPQPSSGASSEQAKKAEQATGTGEKGEATGQAPGSGSQGATGQSTQQGSQDINRQTTQQGSQGATGQGTQQGTQGATGQSTQQGSQDINRQTTQQGSQGATGQGTQQGSQGATGQSTQQGTQQSNEPKAQGAMSGEQKPPAKGPEQSIGEFPSPSTPTFAEIDVNGDHYVTKDELQNFPELLKVFDKVDAGKDGKLEQHEFSNLEAETSREGEI